MESPVDSTNSTSLAQKYQKLAVEYAKIRSSATVLKRALLDEQTKTSSLTDDLLSKDQTIRKKDQEIDSLAFRNTQLEKRVGVLQTELAVVQANQKSKGIGLFHKSNHGEGDSGSTASPTPAPNFDYELVCKIEENIELQRRIATIEESHLKELENLRSEFESRDIGRWRDLDDQMSLLQAQNTSLTHSLQNSMDEIEAYKDQVAQLQGKIIELSHTGEKPEPTKDKENGDEEESNLVTPGPSIMDKLKTAEMEKEHWMLEYHLLEVRLKKITSKLEDTAGALKALGYEDPMSPQDDKLVETTIVGSIESLDPETSLSTLKLDEMSSQIQSYLMSRIHELIILLQESDSRALTFYDEVKNMEKLLKHTNNRRLQIDEELKESKRKYESLESDFRLVKENYEGQLVAMSEHVADLNEKIMAAGEKGKKK